MSDPAGIRKFLSRTGLSSTQFATMLGVHPTIVSRWTTGAVPFERAEGMSGMVARRVVSLANAWDRREGKLLIDTLERRGPIEAFSILCTMATSVRWTRIRSRMEETAK